MPTPRVVRPTPRSPARAQSPKSCGRASAARFHRGHPPVAVAKPAPPLADRGAEGLFRRFDAGASTAVHSAVCRGNARAGQVTVVEQAEARHRLARALPVAQEGAS